jgi:hypothetical protein
LQLSHLAIIAPQIRRALTIVKIRRKLVGSSESAGGGNNSTPTAGGDPAEFWPPFWP